MPLSATRRIGPKITVPTMYVWSDGDTALREKAARLSGDYVAGDYRFEILPGVSHWIPGERPDKPRSYSSTGSALRERRRSSRARPTEMMPGRIDRNTISRIASSR